MSTVFAITAATNSVHLDAQRRGETSFTVSNTSGRPIRGRASLVAEKPVASAWLSLAGASERDLSIAGTTQYTVQIAVPPEAPPGSYPFRLNMVGVENPDELFSEGPSVTFEVPATAPKKRFPWWILLLIGGVLVLGAIITTVILLLPRNVVVPNVAGFTVDAAQRRLEEEGLGVAVPSLFEQSETLAEGLVIRTDPAGGESVKAGSEVTLVVSSGKAPPPTVPPTVTPTPRTPTPTPTPTLTRTPTLTPTPTPTLTPIPTEEPLIWEDSLNDPLEGSRPDFRRLRVGYSTSALYVTLIFASADDLNAAGDFVYMYATNNDMIAFSASSFTLKRDPGKDGLFEETLYSGVPEKTPCCTLQIAIPRSYIPDLVGKQVWVYSMSSKDRVPDGSGRLTIH